MTGRSPIYAHTNATLQGLTTVRAFSANGQLCDELSNHLDLNTSASFQYLNVIRGVSLWLELSLCVYMGVVFYCFLAFGDGKMKCPRHKAMNICCIFSSRILGQPSWSGNYSTSSDNLIVSVYFA